MPITVRQLTNIPFLRTHIQAGAAGADKEISWAHSVELPNPWEWLENGDLLMTVGLGIPSEPADQVSYVESLASVGVSGVAIGRDMHAPPLSNQMMSAAEARSLPILLTAYEVPFIQISRTIAAASRGPEHLRLVKTVRVYDSVRAAMVRSSGPAELLRVLADEINCDLSVCTNDLANEVFPASLQPASAVKAAFLSETRSRGLERMPGILRISVGRCNALVVPVPAQRPSSLIAVPRASDVPPYAILQHVATVAALEYERLIAAREEQRRLGSETLAGLLDARLAPYLAEPLLQQRGLGDGPLVVMLASPAGATTSSLHHVLSERRIGHMLLRRDNLLYCLTTAAERTITEVTQIVAVEGVRMGISDPLTDLSTFSNAVREARWALRLAGTEQRCACRYGDELTTIGPGSMAEAQAIVDRVLGPVIVYDREHGTDLLSSLATFLRCNRSWQRAAEELFIHKQTLIYRMRRVEELTGCALKDTSAIAELWFGITAFDLIA